MRRTRSTRRSTCPTNSTRCRADIPIVMNRRSSCEWSGSSNVIANGSRNTDDASSKVNVVFSPIALGLDGIPLEDHAVILPPLSGRLDGPFSLARSRPLSIQVPDRCRHLRNPTTAHSTPPRRDRPISIFSELVVSITPGPKGSRGQPRSHASLRIVAPSSSRYPVSPRARLLGARRGRQQRPQARPQARAGAGAERTNPCRAACITRMGANICPRVEQYVHKILITQIRTLSERGASSPCQSGRQP